VAGFFPSVQAFKAACRREISWYIRTRESPLMFISTTPSAEGVQGSAVVSLFAAFSFGFFSPRPKIMNKITTIIIIAVIQSQFSFIAFIALFCFIIFFNKFF